MLCFCNLDPQFPEAAAAPLLLFVFSVSSHRKLLDKYSHQGMEEKSFLHLKSANDIGKRRYEQMVTFHKEGKLPLRIPKIMCSDLGSSYRQARKVHV